MYYTSVHLIPIPTDWLSTFAVQLDEFPAQFRLFIDKVYSFRLDCSWRITITELHCVLSKIRSSPLAWTCWNCMLFRPAMRLNAGSRSSEVVAFSFQRSVPVRLFKLCIQLCSSSLTTLYLYTISRSLVDHFTNVDDKIDHRFRSASHLSSVCRKSLSAVQLNFTAFLRSFAVHVLYYRPRAELSALWLFDWKFAAFFFQTYRLQRLLLRSSSKSIVSYLSIFLYAYVSYKLHLARI